MGPAWPLFLYSLGLWLFAALLCLVIGFILGRWIGYDKAQKEEEDRKERALWARNCTLLESEDSAQDMYVASPLPGEEVTDNG